MNIFFRKISVKKTNSIIFGIALAIMSANVMAQRFNQDSATAIANVFVDAQMANKNSIEAAQAASFAVGAFLENIPGGRALANQLANAMFKVESVSYNSLYRINATLKQRLPGYN